MPAYYTYFIASLPMLHFGMKPPFSYAHFLKMCEGFISEKDISILRDFNPASSNQTIQRWLAFDRALRNELVKARAHHRRIDPAKYLRPDGQADSLIAHLALSAHRNPSILEAEKVLDQARWQALDGLERGHYFDTDFLIVYAYKLLLLERWQRINSADKLNLVNEILA